jgi:deoxyribose-phosphate aldolase
MGAHEVDMVIDRGAFLSGNYAKVYDEIVRVKELCAGKAHLKVILETGELGTYDNIRRASLLAIAGGADFLKTSTGKVTRNSELPVALCMLEVIRDVHEETGRVVGMKIAGGIRQSKQAVQYLVQVHETLGPAWLTPDRYRIGASSLLNDVLMQLRKEKTGRYQNPDYFTID